MTKLLSFFEIPADNFDRAVTFYQQVFNLQLTVDECDPNEKMAFFPDGEGAISFSAHIKPSPHGVLISLATESIDQTIEKVINAKGSVVYPKTAIRAEDRGFFAVIIDSEGNKIGLHQK